MAGLDIVNKWHNMPGNMGVPLRWKSVRFRLSHVDDQSDWSTGMGVRRQDPHATRLYQARDVGCRSRDHAITVSSNDHAIITDQFCAKRHELQGKRRLARPGRTDNQHRCTVQKNTTCVDDARCVRFDSQITPGYRRQSGLPMVRM